MAKPDNLLDLMNLGRALTPEERHRLHNPPKQHGHFYTPGTGPEGETCGTCRHIEGRKFKKCALNKARWTRGYGSDIRCKDPACKYWEGA